LRRGWPAYLAKEDIYYEMFYPQIKLISANSGSWLKRNLFSIKEKFIANLSAIIPEPNAGYLAGLTIGGKRAMPGDLQEEFRKAGIIHVVVLSGYNVTIVASAIMSILRGLPLYIGMGFGILGILLFALMAGASATVVRASIMACLVLLSRATGRIYQITAALLAAGFLMVLHNPKILRFDASFQLSFLSTLALIYVSPHIEKKLSFIPKKFGLREITGATISTQIFVLPFLLYKMGLFSIVSLPVNLLVLIFVPATMFFGFLAGIIGFISYLLATPFGWIAYIFSAYELWIVNLFSKLPFAAFNISISFWLMLVIYAIYVIALYKLNKKRPI
jgi:competence protein ComEC